MFLMRNSNESPAYLWFGTYNYELLNRFVSYCSTFSVFVKILNNCLKNWNHIMSQLIQWYHQITNFLIVWFTEGAEEKLLSYFWEIVAMLSEWERWIAYSLIHRRSQWHWPITGICQLINAEGCREGWECFPLIMFRLPVMQYEQPFQKDTVVWLQVSWRKQVLAHTLPGG